jgi:acylphosphatase
MAGKTNDHALSAIIHGAVQGVGFRYSCYQIAVQRGLTGWVRNGEDGSVEVWAEGPQDELEVLLKWLKRGPRWARVNEVESNMEAATGSYKQFDIVG